MFLIGAALHSFFWRLVWIHVNFCSNDAWKFPFCRCVNVLLTNPIWVVVTRMQVKKLIYLSLMFLSCHKCGSNSKFRYLLVFSCNSFLSYFFSKNLNLKMILEVALIKSLNIFVLAEVESHTCFLLLLFFCLFYLFIYFG